MGAKRAVILIILIVAVVIGFCSYRRSSRNAVDKILSEKQLVSILICGGNKFNDNKHRFNCVLTINTETKRAGIVFLPPNFAIDIDDDGNAVKLEDVDVRDFSDMSRAFYKSFRIKPQFYAVFYAPDARKITNIVEGIDIFLPESSAAVHSSVYGMNYLDGEKIMNFINMNDSIYSKYDRLQDIFLTLFEKREMYMKFMNKYTANEIRSSIVTNLQNNEIMSIAEILSSCEELNCINLPGRVSDDGMFSADEISFKMYEDTFLRWLIVKEKNAPNIRVKILNATDIPGLAKRVRSALMREGISVIEFGTHQMNNLEESVIISNKGNNNDIKLVSELTGIKKVYHSVDSTQVYDLTILVGKDMVK